MDEKPVDRRVRKTKRQLRKCMLISLITRLGVSVCKDAGQAGMASMLEIGGTLSAVWIAIPLFEALLSTLEGFL